MGFLKQFPFPNIVYTGLIDDGWIESSKGDFSLNHTFFIIQSILLFLFLFCSFIDFWDLLVFPEASSEDTRTDW